MALPPREELLSNWAAATGHGDLINEEEVMRSDIVPGAAFPDFELPDETGRGRRLSEIQGNDPLCVLLSRGSY